VQKLSTSEGHWKQATYKLIKFDPSILFFKQKQASLRGEQQLKISVVATFGRVDTEFCLIRDGSSANQRDRITKAIWIRPSITTAISETLCVGPNLRYFWIAPFLGSAS